MRNRRTVMLVSLVVLATALASAMAWVSFQRPGPAVPSAVASERSRPAARPSDYVGSQSCAACHAEIFDRYQTHSMAHSMATIGQEPPIEQLEEELLIKPSGRQHAGHGFRCVCVDTGDFGMTIGAAQDIAMGQIRKGEIVQELAFAAQQRRVFQP